jgi:uncharacterized protein (TIGR00266 family)
MRCTNCDAQLPSNARFCTTCGTPVAAATGAFEGGASQTMADVYDNQPGERIDLPDPTVVGTGTGQSGLSYKIIGSTLQAVVIELPAGQELYSERGGMSWMSANIQMETNMEGGLGGAFKRVFSGESIFMVSFKAQGGTGIIGFAGEFPGKVVPLNLGPGQQLICQKEAFMVAERSVQLDIHFRRKLGAGLFGGEGFIMQRITGPGLAFVEFDGEIVEYTLGEGQVLKVDTGHVAMFEPTVQFDVEMVRGFKNMLFGGEGLFLSTLRGPGRVWLQTMPIINLARKLAQYMPSTGSSSSSNNSGGINLGNLFNNS